MQKDKYSFEGKRDSRNLFIIKKSVSSDDPVDPLALKNHQRALLT